MDIKKVTFIIASSLVLCFMASAQSKLISINEKGKLSYHSYTDKGDLLPDFSFCGYKGGGVAIPHIKVTASISPSPNKEDDTPFIQARSHIPVYVTYIIAELILTDFRK